MSGHHHLYVECKRIIQLFALILMIVDHNVDFQSTTAPTNPNTTASLAACISIGLTHLRLFDGTYIDCNGPDSIILYKSTQFNYTFTANRSYATASSNASYFSSFILDTPLGKITGESDGKFTPTVNPGDTVYIANNFNNFVKISYALAINGFPAQFGLLAGHVIEVGIIHMPIGLENISFIEVRVSIFVQSVLISGVNFYNFDIITILTNDLSATGLCAIKPSFDQCLPTFPV